MLKLAKARLQTFEPSRDGPSRAADSGAYQWRTDLSLVGGPPGGRTHFRSRPDPAVGPVVGDRRAAAEALRRLSRSCSVGVVTSKRGPQPSSAREFETAPRSTSCCAIALPFAQPAAAAAEWREGAQPNDSQRDVCEVVGDHRHCPTPKVGGRGVLRDHPNRLRPTRKCFCPDPWPRTLECR